MRRPDAMRVFNAVFGTWRTWHDRRPSGPLMLSYCFPSLLVCSQMTGGKVDLETFERSDGSVVMRLDSCAGVAVGNGSDCDIFSLHLLFRFSHIYPSSGNVVTSSLSFARLRSCYSLVAKSSHLSIIARALRSKDSWPRDNSLCRPPTAFRLTEQYLIARSLGAGCEEFDV